MKLTIDKEILSKVLNFLKSAIPSKVIMGTDEMFLFEINKDQCIISVANSGVQMRSTIKCDSNDEFKFCVPYIQIIGVVQNFPEGNITINASSDKESNEVKSINIKPEKLKKKYTIGCMPSREFIAIPNPPQEHTFKFDLPAGFFNNIMKIVSSNTDSKDTRTCFSDIPVASIDGKLTFISGNSLLLTAQKTNIDYNGKGFILRRQLSDYISSFSDMDKCDIIVTEKSIYIKYGGYEIHTSLCTGGIPEYQKLIGMEPTTGKMVIAKKELQACISRSFMFSDGKLILTAKGYVLKVNASDMESGNSSEEDLDITNPDDASFRLGMNTLAIKSLVSYINDDNISFSHKNGDNIVYFRPDSNNDSLWMLAPILI